MDKLARVMFLLLCHVTSIVKQLVFHADARRIDLMVDGFEDPAYGGTSPPGWQRGLLARTAARAARLQRAYAATALLTCLLWAVFPAADRARGRPVEFPFWVGIDCTHSVVFSLVLTYSFYVTSLVGIANTTMDAFVATVLYQCKTQLTILRRNLETLTERAAREAQDREQFDFILNKLFVDCLDHYKKITETLGLLQDIFGTAILVQFAIGGWILCMAAYKLVSLSVFSVEFASMTLFITCILTELLLYCFYGNEVQVESDRLLQSMYSMQWLRAGPRFRRALLVAMERAKRPLRPAAGLIIPLSLDTFLKILKSSYTFYAVLRQTK
ncbi:odorant receptor 4-like [Amyelois transitella]|uniref:odorant receptor 4-like n=1 Tax=Amyelois transitella TaxID=680683 RepID=UPI00298FA9A4|nr:odorant receptor 4-like [Amyelois transitella]